MADFINRYVRLGGIQQAILVFYSLSLVLLEWLHALGGLPTDAYLLVFRVYYWPVLWLIEHDCGLWWLAELLKGAATS